MRFAWITLLIAVAASAQPGDVLLCDATGVCLSGDEALRYEAARAALDAGRWSEAIPELEALRDLRESTEAPASLLVANDLAVALAGAGRRIEAAFVLEAYLGGREDLDETFGNLLLLYEGLGQPDGGALGLPAPRPSRIERRAASLPVAARTADAARTEAAPVPNPVAMPSAGARADAPPVAEDLRAALERWRRDWMRGDVEAYLAHYVDGVSPRADMSRSAWVEQRRALVRPERAIDVRIDALEASSLDADRVVTRFLQSYSARGYSDRMRKRLLWVRGDDGWRIREEGADTP